MSFVGPIEADQGGKRFVRAGVHLRIRVVHTFGLGKSAARARDRRSPYRRDVAHRHLEYSFQSQAPSTARESRLSRQSNRVGIFVIFGRRGRGTCGPGNQFNHSPAFARRKVIHHRLRTPTPRGASPLVNNFGGTIRVGIGLIFLQLRGQYAYY